MSEISLRSCGDCLQRGDVHCIMWTLVVYSILDSYWPNSKQCVKQKITCTPILYTFKVGAVYKNDMY